MITQQLLPSISNHVKSRVKHARVVSFPLASVFCCISLLIGLWIGMNIGFQDTRDPKINQISAAQESLTTSTQPQSTTMNSQQGGGSEVVSRSIDHKYLEEVLVDSGFEQERPPLHPGSKGEEFYRVIPQQILSWYPRIILLPGLLADWECDYIKSIAEPELKPSNVVNRQKGGKQSAKSDVRTSEGMFISSKSPLDKEGVLLDIEKRMAAVTHIPMENGEAFNVLRYQDTQHYNPHFDHFDERMYGTRFAGNNRVATILSYLSDVDEGGETIFPREGMDGEDRGFDPKKCDQGFKVKPRKGDAVLFYSVDSDYQLDKHALHGACAVVSGEKWVMTKWLKNVCIGCAPGLSFTPAEIQQQLKEKQLEGKSSGKSSGKSQVL